MTTISVGVICLLVGFALGYVICAALLHNKIYELEEDLYEYQMILEER
jgi:uncharacterized protein YneF (UPF0154 family)